MKNRLNRNLEYWFGISVSILVVITAVSYSIIHNLLESRKLVDHSNAVILQLERAISSIQDAESSQRGFILTGDQELLNRYSKTYKNGIDRAIAVQRLTADNLYQQYYIQNVLRYLDKEQGILDEMVRNKQVRNKISKADLEASKVAMDAIRNNINHMDADEADLLRVRLAELNKYTDLSRIMIVVSSLFALVVSFIFFRKIVADLDEKEAMQNLLEQKERETAVMNEELGSANEELVSLNEEYMASIDQLHESQQNLQELNEELEERVKMRTLALEQSENRLRSMMDTIPQIAWTSMPGGEVNFYNRRWFEYTGLSFEDTRAWGWKSVIHPDDLEYNLEQLGVILNSGEDGEFEIREKSKEGHYRWHLVRMRPIKDETGKVNLWVGTATDIQELKQLQQQKDDFISIASHELKTPVTTLKASLQMITRLKSDPASDKFNDMLDRANRSMNKVTSLIEDLLNVGRISQGHMELHRTTVKLSKIVDDCAAHVRASGHFVVNVTGDTDLQVNADADRIEQVITNFINNATKYAPDSKEIQVEIKQVGQMAKVSVTDHGPGIAQEKIPYQFDRYFRIETDRSQSSGLGLGLYICSEIIKKHSGQIGVATTEGQGSTFWFTLPL